MPPFKSNFICDLSWPLSNPINGVNVSEFEESITYSLKYSLSHYFWHLANRNIFRNLNWPKTGEVYLDGVNSLYFEKILQTGAKKSTSQGSFLFEGKLSGLSVVTWARTLSLAKPTMLYKTSLPTHRQRTAQIDRHCETNPLHGRR